MGLAGLYGFPYPALMQSQKATLVQGGKVALPARFRKALGMQPGDRLIVELGEDEMRLRPANAWVARAQALVSAMGQPERSLVDELIAERRDEAARE